MFKSVCVAAALALGVSACSTTGANQFASNAATTVSAITAVNSALIQLDANSIGNTAKLAAALAQINCPIINASVSLGKAIASDPNVAANVAATLNLAGPGGALAADVCKAAGYGPAAPASTAPAAAVTSAS